MNRCINPLTSSPAALRPPALPLTSATDKVNDFNLVVLFNACARPVGATHDFSISLYRQAFGRERQMMYQSVQCYLVGHFAGFAVNSHAQVEFRSSTLMNDAAQLGLVAVGYGANEQSGASGLEVRKNGAHRGDAIHARLCRKDQRTKG